MLLLRQPVVSDVLTRDVISAEDRMKSSMVSMVALYSNFPPEADLSLQFQRNQFSGWLFGATKAEETINGTMIVVNP